MIMKRILITLGLSGLAAIPALPWGQKGHDTVAFIAENHLTPATQAAVGELLDGKSIVYWANWLDNASHTDEYAYTKTWHYKNIDADETFESAKLNPKGDIVQAINAQYGVLSNPESTLLQKQLALKMLVHFLGDIHQPMHTGRASDRGGNNHSVTYFKSPANLHGVWDSRVLESGHKWSYTEWQNQVDRATPEMTEIILENNTPAKWAKESHEIAKEIYEQTPEDTNIEYTYIARWTPVIEQQLLKGGLRLADLLNSVFDAGYKGYFNTDGGK